MRNKMNLSKLLLTLNVFLVIGTNYRAIASDNPEKYYEVPPEILSQELRHESLLNLIGTPILSGRDYLSAVNDPALGYRVVALIDKSSPGTSPSAQTMSIFIWDEVQESFKFYERWRVSTGVERPSDEKIGKDENERMVHSERKTPIGFYRSELLEEDHVSKAFDAHMFFAVFYDVNGGLAVHGVPRNEYNRLGRRASHGCSRLTLEHAQIFYDLIKSFEFGTVVKLEPDSGKVQSSISGPVVLRSYRALVINTETSMGVPTVEVNGQVNVLYPPEFMRDLDKRNGETVFKIKIDPSFYQSHPERIMDLFPRVHVDSTRQG